MRHEDEPKPEETEAGEDEHVEPAETKTKAPEPEAPAAPPPEPEKVYVGTGISWAILFGVVLIVVIAILALRNTASVTVDLLFWQIEAPLISVILGVAAITVVIDELIGMILRIRKRRLKKQKEELKRLKKGSK